MANKSDLRSRLKDNCVIILDTNCFLELYRYSANSSKTVESVLQEIKAQIWIPDQIYVEFLNNKEKVKTEQYSKYKMIERDLKKEANEMLSRLNNYFKKYKKYGYPDSVKQAEEDIICKVEDIKSILDKLKQTLKEDDEQNENMLYSDMPLNFIETLNESNQIGAPFTISEKIKIYKEGEIRYKLKIPPGYQDLSKDNHDAIKVYGDLVIWKSILKYAKENNRLNNIIFITNDIKSDWWENINKKPDLVPRKELVQEFKEYSNCEFGMYTLYDFVSNYIDHKTLNKKQIITLDATKMVLQFFETHNFHEFAKFDAPRIAEFLNKDFSFEIVNSHCLSMNLTYVEIDNNNEVKSIGDVELQLDLKVENILDGWLDEVNMRLAGIVEIDFSFINSPSYSQINYYIDNCSRLSFPVLHLTDIL